MKTLLLAITLLASSIAANAQLIIYKTVGRQTVIGAGKITNVASKGYLLIDLVTGESTAVGAFTINGQKLFSVVPLLNYHFVQVTGPSGTPYDVLAKAESPGTQFAGVILESAFMQGKESMVTIDSGGPRSLPRRLTSVGQNISENGALKVFGVSVGSGVLDTKGSTASNNSGENLNAAAERLAAGFASVGYTQITLPPP